jgi:hypothetical protein
LKGTIDKAKAGIPASDAYPDAIYHFTRNPFNKAGIIVVTVD